MKCEQGDLAKIIYSIRPENVGKVVRVEKYIGHYQRGDTFDFRGIPCQCAVTDHYWWISADRGLSNMMGDTPKAYIPDTWLEPIRPEAVKEREKVDVEIEA